MERHAPATASDEAIAEFHELWVGESRESRPLDPPLPLEVLKAAARTFPEFMETVVYLARAESGDAAGFAMVVRRRTGAEPHLAEMRMWAKPAYRRKGVGAALLGEVCIDAEGTDLREFVCTTTEGIGWGAELCGVIGSVPAQKRRTWRLPVKDLDRDELRSIAARAAERARGYEVVDAQSPLPEALVEEAVELLEFLADETVIGADESGPRLTVEALRQLEKTWQAIGMGRLWQFARHEDSGTLAAVVDAVWHQPVSRVVTQDHTVVRPEFRGRSLGLWMKACMIDKILDAWPEAEEIRTTTTAPNPAMDSVDERLGFEPYLTTTVWRVGVDALRRWLDAPRETT